MIELITELDSIEHKLAFLQPKRINEIFP